MKNPWMLPAGVMFMSAALTAPAVEVRVSIREPAGIARSAQPATGGIPFKPGTVKSADELVLVNATGKPVPAQFTVLARHEDGSAQWVLVDTLTDMSASGTQSFTLKTGSGNPAPATPLKIREDAATVTVDTGAIRFTIGKNPFALFDSVEIGGKKVVSGGSVELENCELEKVEPTSRKEKVHFSLKSGGKTFPCKAGRPNRVKWEYRGLLRATLRVDGDFEGEGGPPLSYTARITAWAGSTSVRVRFAVRNSHPVEGHDAFIKRAAVSLKLASAAADEGTGLDWAAGSDGSIGLLVQHRHTAGVYKGPGTYLRDNFGCGWYGEGWPGLYGQGVKDNAAFVEIVSFNPSVKNQKQGELGFHPSGMFALADRAHKESEAWFDFYTGRRDVAANESRARAFRSKLLIVAPGEWYSEAEGLAMGRFGTLADEIVCYKKWGWKGWDDEAKIPKMPHQPFAFVPKEWVHDVSEDDCVEGYLIQFLRTGERGFFDWAEAWAGLYRGHSISRDDWGETWGVAAPQGTRPANGLSFGWYGPHRYEWADSRQHRCHHYGRGIFEYYMMTGDTDALEAGLDLARQVTGPYAKHKTGSFAFGRSFGRAFLTAISAWKATRGDQWKDICDNMAAMILEGKNWDPELGIYRQSLGIKNSYFARAWAKGHFDETKPKSWKLRDIPETLDRFLAEQQVVASYNRGNIMAKKGDDVWEVTYLTQLFELSACHLAMERYARLFKSDPMSRRMVEVSAGVDKQWWSDKVNFMIGSPYFGWPRKDKTLDPYEWGGPDPKISGYATRYTTDMFARAYSVTKDARWLELALRSWNRGSKRGYNATRQSAANDEVGEFAYIRGAHNNTMTECSVRLFYEAARAE